jgi:hypothetical protein
VGSLGTPKNPRRTKSEGRQVENSLLPIFNDSTTPSILTPPIVAVGVPILLPDYKTDSSVLYIDARVQRGRIVGRLRVDRTEDLKDAKKKFRGDKVRNSNCEFPKALLHQQLILWEYQEPVAIQSTKF